MKNSAKIIFLTMLIVTVFILIAFKNVDAEEEENIIGDNVNLSYATSSENSNYGVDIFVDPDGIAINAVLIELSYSTSTLTALNISLDNSFCTLVVFSEVDMLNGVIRVACGKPNPGIDQKDQVAHIDFKINNNSNNYGFHFSDNSIVLANDGYGTNVLKNLIE